VFVKLLPPPHCCTALYRTLWCCCVPWVHKHITLSHKGACCARASLSSSCLHKSSTLPCPLPLAAHLLTTLVGCLHHLPQASNHAHMARTQLLVEHIVRTQPNSLASDRRYSKRGSRCMYTFVYSTQGEGLGACACNSLGRRTHIWEEFKENAWPRPWLKVEQATGGRSLL